MTDKSKSGGLRDDPIGIEQEEVVLELEGEHVVISRVAGGRKERIGAIEHVGADFAWTDFLSESEIAGLVSAGTLPPYYLKMKLIELAESLGSEAALRATLGAEYSRLERFARNRYGLELKTYHQIDKRRRLITYVFSFADPIDVPTNEALAQLFGTTSSTANRWTRLAQKARWTRKPRSKP